MFFAGYMLAGLWGAKIWQDRVKMHHLAANMFEQTPRHYWDFDQALLRRIMWPEAVRNSLQHDSYTCTYKKFSTFHKTQPFPTKRDDNQLHVGWGSIKGDKNKTGIKPCPNKCRKNIEWTFC